VDDLAPLERGREALELAGVLDDLAEVLVSSAGSTLPIRTFGQRAALNLVYVLQSLVPPAIAADFVTKPYI
jgi:hypothetical protein